MPEQLRFLKGLLPWPAKLFVAVAAVLALASYAWHRIEASRDSDPPLPLGAVERKGFFACPALQGSYTWGRHIAREEGGSSRGWKGPVPFLIYDPETQVWIRMQGKDLEIRSRLIVRAANVRNRLAQEWSTARYGPWEYSCRSGVMEVEETEIETGEDFGGKGIRRGFKLARLADGGLAVGVRTTAYGRRSSLFAWGDVSAGSIPMPPRTTWRWIKLASQGAGDGEPAPVKGSRQ